MATDILINRVQNSIRDIPDFPKEGIVFKDITPILLDAQLSRDILADFIEHAKTLNPTVVCAIDSRGFIFGPGIAQALDIPLLLVRKKGKLPGETIECTYTLEYGTATLEIHKDDLPECSKVLIHDDLLATGGTAAATASLIQSAGSEVVGYSFLVHLGFLNGGDKLKEYKGSIYSVVEY